MADKDPEGLSTVDALEKLHKDIQFVLNQFIASQQARKSKSWIRDALHHHSLHTTITWISTVYIIFVIIIQIIVYIKNSDNSPLVFCQPIIICILSACSIYIELHTNKLRHNEIPNRIENLLHKIQFKTTGSSWLYEHYPHPLIPFSPSITLQWTYRDNKLVHLPWALLVTDDIVLIRPGQISPGFCESIEKCSEYQLLHAKEVYGPTLHNANECFGTPKTRKPLEYRKYRLLETPYLNNLKVYLDQALDRPTTVENRLRHFLMMTIIERLIFPLVLGLMIIVNCIRYFYFDAFKWISIWDLFIYTPIAAIIPLLPLLFPVAWNCINCFGMARFKLVNSLHLQQRKKLLDDEDDISECHKYDFRYMEVWNEFKNILNGKETMLWRTTNLLHMLGSLTALCCVDKKGILSWPNPAAEKVFFLHNQGTATSQASKVKTNNKEDDDTKIDTGCAPDSEIAISEVLDITHHPNDPFQLHFDNTKWEKYLKSLKPLGLAILLNTCNIDTQENYMKFCSHITCEAMYNENLIPVTNRRCLCELAKEIGFVDEAQKIFSLEHQLYTFRHLQNEVARRDSKFARSLQMSTKLKFPFPHMFAVAVKEIYGGTMQLLSQGTADIILDSCVDYWDGSNIRALSNSDRKQVQDFYQRSTLTAYCTAFAYRPLHRGFSEKFNKIYLELPRDCRYLYLNHRSPTAVHSDIQDLNIKNTIEYLSSDSLVQNDSPSSDVSDVEDCFEMQCNQVFIGMVTMQYQAQQDMVNLIEQLEKSCIRFVHFSKENELRSRVFNEKMGLESGWNCHISLLSERGRRDSGPWECWANNGTVRVSSPINFPCRRSENVTHKFGIDKPLQPSGETDSNVNSAKALSYSAPGAINLEHSVVKFDTEHEPLTLNIFDQETEDSTEEPETGEFDMTNAQHEWQSLSCLTDSTDHSVPVNFDMSNRAMLPKGIENIRPHIENADNVPLLVSLFTDCTPTNTKEMIKIMQEYGEVICVIGSSANNENSGIFMQANASISIEPLYPQICCKAENFKPVVKGSLSPIELSRALNSIPCSLSVKREDPLIIYYLIVEARAFTTLLRNTMQFWIGSCLTVSLMQLFSAFLMLPPLLTIGQVMWICCVIIPLLSVSLMGSPINRESMMKPQEKKKIGFSYQKLMFVLRYYGLKFIPMIFIVILCFGGSLASYCTDKCLVHNCTCIFLYIPDRQLNSNVFNNWTERAQQFCAILILLHLVTISITFIHRQESVWQKSPHKNFLWLGTVILLLVLQIAFSLSSLSWTTFEYESIPATHIGKVVAAFAFVSPLITLFMCEIVKRQEIKENCRYERRRKLEFGTKLGMNSPF